MGIIKKDCGITTAVFSTICLILGVCILAVSILLLSKVPNHITHTNGQETCNEDVKFSSFWWGGVAFLIPGILGIAAACTRNVVVMTVYLVFNLLCMLTSLGMTVLVLLFWIFFANKDSEFQSSFAGCQTVTFSGVKCICGDLSAGDFWVLKGVTCEDLSTALGLSLALLILGGLLTVLSSIASYISCCALCNQEQERMGGIIFQPPYQVPGAAYPQPAGGFYPSGQYQQPYAAYPPGQYNPVYTEKQHGDVKENDTAKLVANQVI